MTPPAADAATVAAPWRSLIYRNVDTPFTYFDDFVIFPHMPMNTRRLRLPRAAHHGRLDGQHPGAACGDPTAERRDRGAGHQSAAATLRGGQAGRTGLQRAVADAEQRLEQYHEGGRAQSDVLGRRLDYHVPRSFSLSDYCPDDADIIDPDVGGTMLDAAGPLVPALAREGARRRLARARSAKFAIGR